MPFIDFHCSLEVFPFNVCDSYCWHEVMDTTDTVKYDWLTPKKIMWGSLVLHMCRGGGGLEGCVKSPCSCCDVCTHSSLFISSPVITQRVDERRSLHFMMLSQVKNTITHSDTQSGNRAEWPVKVCVTPQPRTHSEVDEVWGLSLRLAVLHCCRGMTLTIREKSVLCCWLHWRDFFYMNIWAHCQIWVTKDLADTLRLRFFHIHTAVYVFRLFKSLSQHALLYALEKRKTLNLQKHFSVLYVFSFNASALGSVTALDALISSSNCRFYV